MRRSLFTALLRQAVDYRIHLDNFEECLYQGEYLRDVRPALDRFLAGNTYYWGGKTGFVEAFRLIKDQERLCFLLRDTRKFHHVKKLA